MSRMVWDDLVEYFGPNSSTLHEVGSELPPSKCLNNSKLSKHFEQRGYLQSASEGEVRKNVTGEHITALTER
jgi:hypothetical protein